jgi:alpha-mannosidase
LSSDIIGRYFYHFNCTNNTSWKATINKLYRPDFFNVYSDFFDRRYENGKVAILNSSHQDIAWVDRPEGCKILRDTLLLTPILQDAFKRDDYGFDIEDGLMLREYLERHPNSQKKLTELLNRKLISVGATYNCPYEDMYDAEDQVRQLYLGKRWVKDMFGGYDSKVYWNVDVPGKTIQYPQILKKAGVDYMVISRHAKGMFYWQSPDGSTVFTYSPGHYGNDIIHLSKDLGNKIKYGAEQVIHWDQYYANSINYTPLLSDQDMLPAIDYSEFIEVWNGFESVRGDDGKENQVYFPDMELMTMDEFMPLASEHATTADTIKGERPNVWIYIHGPSHHEALTASRQASKLITSAEKFLAISSLIDSDKMPYPALDIDKAWQAKIYPDHGWGGHDGDITDNLFKAKFVEARTASEDLLNRATEFISGRVDQKRESGIPVMLFNALGWDRIDPVEVDLDLPKGRYFGLNVIDKGGQAVESQLKNIVRFDDGSINRVKVVFIAKVPSLGYTTYYMENDETIFEPRVASFSKDNYENDFYVISLANGGIEQIYDKKLNKDLLKTNQLKGGEVFTLQSVGNGAGEFGDVQQPTMVDFDKVSDHKTSWEIIDQGPVYVTYQLRQQIKDAVVEIDMTVYHELKRIFFETHLLNWSGRMYREYRTAFPVNMENAEISYEVPFGEVKVGEDEIRTAGERYVPLCKDVHPRSVIDWFAASEDKMSIVISSSVSAFDWIDPTDDQSEALLQHILLASRKSCHGEGNDYSQAGNHAYNYMLTSNSINEVSGKRLAKQHNNPVYIEVNPEISINASLPEEMSFISTDNESVIISAVKKAEDNDNLIVRIYDASGKQNQVDIKTWKKIKAIFSTDILENNPEKVSGMKVPPYSIETFMLELDE